MSSPEHNMSIVQAAFDAINVGDYEALAGTITEDFVRHDLGSTFPTGTREDFLQFIQALKSAMPDFHMEAAKMIGTEDDHVAAIIKVGGTHTGDLLGMPPTGRHVEIKGSSLYYFVDGLIHDNWQLLDEAGLMKQLTAAPAPASDGQTVTA